MFQRVNRLPIELPEVEYGDASSASAVQELLVGKFGVMSTLNNYMYQSFNFREKVRLKPFYDLVASITAEKMGHVELVATTINLLNKGSSNKESTGLTQNLRNAKANNTTFQSVSLYDAIGLPWTGGDVLLSGNLVLDLLQNFYLECAARTQKLRVYEMSEHPVAREMIGYLLVRGGTHIVAFAKALEMATGVHVTKMLPIPSLDIRLFDEARKYEELGFGHVLFTWNDVGDYTDITKIWKGQHPITGEKLIVKEGMPEEFGRVPDLDANPEAFAPGIELEEFHAIAKRLLAKS